MFSIPAAVLSLVNPLFGSALGLLSGYLRNNQDIDHKELTTRSASDEVIIINANTSRILAETELVKAQGLGTAEQYPLEHVQQLGSQTSLKDDLMRFARPLVSLAVFVLLDVGVFTIVQSDVLTGASKEDLRSFVLTTGSVVIAYLFATRKFGAKETL